MTRTILPLSIFCLSACFGGESGTPTPAIPDPGCTQVPGSSAIDDWSETETAFRPARGTWRGECGGQRFEVSVPTFTSANASGTRDPNEWLAYGNDEVPPRECRDSYRVYFGSDGVVGDDALRFATQAVYGGYVPTYDGMPAGVDRYAHAWTELHGDFVEGGRPGDYSMPATAPYEVAISWSGMLSEDGTELRGTLQWYGDASDPPPPMIVPDEGDGPSTEPWNPNPNGSFATEPAMVVASCDFTLRREPYEP